MKKYIEVTPENRAFPEEGRPLEKDRQARAGKRKQTARHKHKIARVMNVLDACSSKRKVDERNTDAKPVATKQHNVEKRCKHLK